MSAALWAFPRPSTTTCIGTDHCPGFCLRRQVYRHLRAWKSTATPTYTTPAWSLSLRSWAAMQAGWPPPPLWPAWTGCGPDLIYLPEVDFDMDQFTDGCRPRSTSKTGNCMVAVSEGIHYADGTFVSEAKTSATDGFRPCSAGRSGRHAGRHRQGGDRRQGARH